MTVMSIKLIVLNIVTSCKPTSREPDLENSANLMFGSVIIYRILRCKQSQPQRQLQITDRMRFFFFLFLRFPFPCAQFFRVTAVNSELKIYSVTLHSLSLGDGEFQSFASLSIAGVFIMRDVYDLLRAGRVHRILSE